MGGSSEAAHNTTTKVNAVFLLGDQNMFADIERFLDNGASRGEEGDASTFNRLNDRRQATATARQTGLRREDLRFGLNTLRSGEIGTAFRVDLSVDSGEIDGNDHGHGLGGRDADISRYGTVVGESHSRNVLAGEHRVGHAIESAEESLHLDLL